MENNSKMCVFIVYLVKRKFRDSLVRNRILGIRVLSSLFSHSLSHSNSLIAAIAITNRLSWDLCARRVPWRTRCPHSPDITVYFDLTTSFYTRLCSVCTNAPLCPVAGQLEPRGTSRTKTTRRNTGPH
jgi:hypothetical protein